LAGPHSSQGSTLTDTSVRRAPAGRSRRRRYWSNTSSTRIPSTVASSGVRSTNQLPANELRCHSGSSSSWLVMNLRRASSSRARYDGRPGARIAGRAAGDRDRPDRSHRPRDGTPQRLHPLTDPPFGESVNRRDRPSSDLTVRTRVTLLGRPGGARAAVSSLTWAGLQPEQTLCTSTQDPALGRPQPRLLPARGLLLRLRLPRLARLAWRRILLRPLR